MIGTFITDPELVIPELDGHVPGPIMTRSAFMQGIYPTVDVLVRHRRDIEFALSEVMSDAQRAITSSTWVLTALVPAEDPPDTPLERTDVIPIFGYVPAIDAVIASVLGDGFEREDEGRDPNARRSLFPHSAGVIRRRLEDTNLRGWLWGHWHSMLRPEGVWCCVHRAAVHQVLSEELFQEARRRGWSLD